MVFCQWLSENNYIKGHADDKVVIDLFGMLQGDSIEIIILKASGVRRENHSVETRHQTSFLKVKVCKLCSRNCCGGSPFVGVDFFVSNVDPLKKPPLITANSVHYRNQRSAIESENNFAIHGAIEDLQASTLCLPVIGYAGKYTGSYRQLVSDVRFLYIGDLMLFAANTLIETIKYEPYFRKKQIHKKHKNISLFEVCILYCVAIRLFWTWCLVLDSFDREGAVADKVREAHSRVTVANHPDAASSHYLPSKINETKDVMLGKSKNTGYAFVVLIDL
ncbi:DnaJ domain-containing protein [Artemisia annua]|uniref:DnaJ domain-containing protein n=1 Tax=Artemisia annua TaxID=35608 RepID=A0A2U1M7C0_ARTAN|nr:DnaJ domain-containing protein [Artemisia annua]